RAEHRLQTGGRRRRSRTRGRSQRSGIIGQLLDRIGYGRRAVIRRRGVGAIRQVYRLDACRQIWDVDPCGGRTYNSDGTGERAETGAGESHRRCAGEKICSLQIDLAWSKKPAQVRVARRQSVEVGAENRGLLNRYLQRVGITRVEFAVARVRGVGSSVDSRIEDAAIERGRRDFLNRAGGDL